MNKRAKLLTMLLLTAALGIAGCGNSSKVNETVENEDTRMEDTVLDDESSEVVTSDEVTSDDKSSEDKSLNETTSKKDNTKEEITSETDGVKADAEEATSGEDTSEENENIETKTEEKPLVEETTDDKEDIEKSGDEAEEVTGEPVYTGSITEYSEIKYSKVQLNVRKGPGTEWGKLGFFNINDEVKVTGGCDNGWSRVEYKGEEAYVNSKYLSDTKVEVPKPANVTGGNYSDTAKVAAEMASRPGMTGRLYIPGVGLNVAIFNGWSQGVIDAGDSAGTYRYGGGQMMIADHKNQGFSAIKSAVPGQTVAYINNGSTVQAYMCIAKGTGQNTATGVPYDLLDCNGNSLYLQNAGGIGMYTCNSHWSSITYTCWQPI